MADSADLVTLKEFFLELSKAQQNAIAARFDAMDKALEKAEALLAVRLETLNALRSEVTTDRGMYQQRKECELLRAGCAIWRDTVNEKLTTLRTTVRNWLALAVLIIMAVEAIFKVMGR